MGSLLYLIREGVRGFYQAKRMMLLSIATIAFVLLLACCIAVGALNIRKLLQSAGEEADVVVYVKDRTVSDSSALASLVDEINCLPQVHTTSVVDKSAAWERFADMYGREMLSAVDENPFPVSIEISLKKNYRHSRSVAGLSRRLDAIEGVDGVRYAKEWMDFMTRFKWYFYGGAAILGIIIFTTLHITISNTIKLTIYARRELIRNMHLVGATKSFISMPFIIEGMIQGLVGGILGIVLFYLLKSIFTCASFLSTIPLTWGTPVLPLLFILLGVFFGWTGSASAVRKFLA